MQCAKNSEFTALEREHESKGSSSRKSRDVLWEDREDSALLPRALYVFFPVVISCKFLLAAGTGTSVCFSTQSWMSAVRSRLIYQAGINMILGAAGAILPLKCWIRPTSVVRF